MMKINVRHAASLLILGVLTVIFVITKPLIHTRERFEILITFSGGQPATGV